MLRSLERAFKRLLSAALRAALGSSTAPPLPRDSGLRILIIRQHNQLGDMLCVVPLLRALKGRYPGAHIALMASPVNHEPMIGNRFLDEVLLFDKRRFLGGRGGSLLRFPAYVRTLRRLRFDIAAVPATVSTSFTSDLLAYLTGARWRIGAASIQGIPNPSGFFFTHARDLDWRGMKACHQTRRNADIWPEKFEEPLDLTVEMTLSAEECAAGCEAMRRLAHGAGRAVVYHPGAGKVPNRWPAHLFARLAEELSGATGAATVITAGPMDDEPVGAMTEALRVPHEIIRNRPIREVAAALRCADLVVSNDTGIMHVAGAVGTPVLSLFGPTDPEEWAPTGPRHRSIRGEGGDIRNIRYDDVVKTAMEMLDRRERA